MRKPEDALEASLSEAHLQPLWDRYMQIITREPRSEAAFAWHWSRLQTFIERAAGEIDGEDAERRVLLFANPAYRHLLPLPVATKNLTAGLQILKPGEHARPHRHTAAALRLVLSGAGAVTMVNGKECAMEPGDLISTPAWTWHEHRGGTERVVWLDALDVPLSAELDAIFFEAGPPHDLPTDASSIPDVVLAAGGMAPPHPVSLADHSPLYRYPWSTAQAALARLPPSPDGSRVLRYVNPLSGAAIMATLDCYVTQLTRGMPTDICRSTANSICVVLEGEGLSRIADQEIAWGPRDVFTVPRWKWVTHTATTAGACFFTLTDRELYRRLGLLREEWNGRRR